MIEWIRSKYFQALNSIAFYPLIMAMAFLALSIFSIRFSGGFIDKELEEIIPIFTVSGASAVRTLLSVLAAGLFSLTVFSFSMVMVVISQAANNYSPKILDGFLKAKTPQLILGFYIGSLIYCLPLLLYISDENNELMPLSGILLALLLSILDLFLFIRFIDYVSQSVKPYEISRRIYSRTKARWDSEIKNEDKKPYEKVYEIAEPKVPMEIMTARISGNFQGVNEDALFDICEKNDLRIELIPRIGHYILKDTPLFKVYPSVKNNEKLCTAIYNTFNFSGIEDIDKNLYFGYRQLTEIAAKALSPGINDIGTARICIDFLTDLISVFGKRRTILGLVNREGKLRVILNPIRLHELFEMCMDEIRLCGRNDKNIMYALIHSCGMLLNTDFEIPEMKKQIKKFAKKIRKDLKSENHLNDTAYLKSCYKEMILSK